MREHLQIWISWVVQAIHYSDATGALVGRAHCCFGTLLLLHGAAGTSCGGALLSAIGEQLDLSKDPKLRLVHYSAHYATMLCLGTPRRPRFLFARGARRSARPDPRSADRQRHRPTRSVIGRSCDGCAVDL